MERGKTRAITALHRVGGLAPFSAATSSRGGVFRLHCDVCGHDRLVVFSRRRRGLPSSCGGHGSERERPEAKASGRSVW